MKKPTYAIWKGTDTEHHRIGKVYKILKQIRVKSVGGERMLIYYFINEIGEQDRAPSQCFLWNPIGTDSLNEVVL